MRATPSTTRVEPAALTLALAGNPNCGKTTLFNALTGSHAHVGNYPGVTVEIKTGAVRRNGADLRIVDLPGTYSLTAHSMEEVVARDYIIDQKPDVVVHIVDASNLQRHLYLTTQLLELGAPLVIALNMVDMAEQRGLTIDVAMLSGLLGVPVVPTVGTRGEGLDDLLDAAVDVARRGASAVAAQRLPEYGSELEPHVRQMAALVEAELGTPVRARWYAVKLLEDDERTGRRLAALAPQGLDRLVDEAARQRRHIESVFGDTADIILADRRYGYIAGACKEAIRRQAESRRAFSDRIDVLLTHHALGLPVFAVLMYLTFHLVFTLGELPESWIRSGFGLLAAAVGSLWSDPDALLRSLVVDGIINGVGAVLELVPYIALLFLAIAILEGTGYMARAAFVMDRFMHKIGLHGKSFIPMLIGFGCTVPAIMATRMLESRRDRLVTMLIVPFMSCGARLSIYTVFIAAFFPRAWKAPVLLSLYVIGIVAAIVAARLMRSTIFKGEAMPFVMELPPYRKPTLKGLAVHVWEPTRMYIRKAATVILAFAIVLWALTTFPRKTHFDRDYDALAVAAATIPDADLRENELRTLEAQRHQERLLHTAAGRLGRWMEPAIRPLGFDWKIGTALIGALGAKEAFVTQMSIVYAVGDDEAGRSSLRQKIVEDYDHPLVGYCIMLFCLLTAPCVATVAMIRRESGSWGWAIAQLAGMTAVAYVTTFVVYQVGSLLLP
ncbi:MAG: ferrous iron transport protein B [Planctomycetes bacterium]|nr:ferrous iron transport protein B [Planctomycetota bacterium]